MTLVQTTDAYKTYIVKYLFRCCFFKYNTLYKIRLLQINLLEGNHVERDIVSHKVLKQIVQNYDQEIIPDFVLRNNT